MSKKQTSVSGAGRSPASRYTDEFKRDAVRLVSQEKYSFKAAATAVNVSEKSLREWYSRFAPQPIPCGEDAVWTNSARRASDSASNSNGPN